MSELADKKLKEWRAGAIRTLFEAEQMTWVMRNLLEGDPRLPLSALEDKVADLRSFVLSVETFLDKTKGLKEAGL